MQRYKFFIDEKNKDYVYQYINKINPEYREQYMRDFVIYDVEKIDNDTLYYMDIINASHLEKIIEYKIPYVLVRINYSVMSNQQFKQHRALIYRFFDIIEYENKDEQPGLNDFNYYILLKRKSVKNVSTFPMFFDETNDFQMYHTYMEDIKEMPTYDEIDMFFGIENVSDITGEKEEIRTQCFHKGKFYYHHRMIEKVYASKLKNNNIYIINNSQYDNHQGIITDVVPLQLGVETNSAENVFQQFTNIPEKFERVLAVYLSNMMSYFFNKYNVRSLMLNELILIQKKFPIYYQDRGRAKKYILNNEIESLILYLVRNK